MAWKSCAKLVDLLVDFPNAHGYFLANSPQAALPHGGRLLALDWGEKRIGVAISDPEQRVAHPLGTLTRRHGKRFPLKQLKFHLDAYHPVGILVGLPLEASGEEGSNAEKARQAGASVHSKAGVPIVFWDERMTSARAERAARELGVPIRGRRGEVDTLAATILLQNYLDSRRS